MISKHSQRQLSSPSKQSTQKNYSRLGNKASSPAIPGFQRSQRNCKHTGKHECSHKGLQNPQDPQNPQNPLGLRSGLQARSVRRTLNQCLKTELHRNCPVCCPAVKAWPSTKVHWNLPEKTLQPAPPPLPVLPRSSVDFSGSSVGGNLFRSVHFVPSRSCKSLVGRSLVSN